MNYLTSKKINSERSLFMAALSRCYCGVYSISLLSWCLISICHFSLIAKDLLSPVFVRGYSRWYGTDRLCAILELRMLDVSIPEERLEQARRHRRAKAPRWQASPSAAGEWLDLATIFADDPIALWQLGE